MTVSETAELSGLAVRDLLDLVGGLLAGEGGSPERAGFLRRALDELGVRASRILPAVPVACACGEVFASPDELDEHFWAVFVPADDTGADGKTHTEMAASSQGPPSS
jgi:hypothetical protein